MLQHYYDYMVDMAVIFGANVTTAPYEILDVLTFERTLANVLFSVYIKIIITYKHDTHTKKKLVSRDMCTIFLVVFSSSSFK